MAGIHRIMFHFGFTPIAVVEVGAGDEVVGGEPAFASPTTESTNSDFSLGK